MYWFVDNLDLNLCLVCSSGPAVLDAVAVFPAEVGVVDRWCAGIVGGGNNPALWGVLPVMWLHEFPRFLRGFVRRV